MSVPWDFDQARTAADNARKAHTNASDEIKSAYRAYGLKERDYRIALAVKIAELRSQGTALTVCRDLARGDERIAELKFQSEVADGCRESARSAAYKANADRREVEQLIEWSMRRDLAEGYANVLAKPIGPVFGGTRG